MKPRKKVYYNNSKEIVEQASKVVKDVVKNYFESLNEEIASTIKNSISTNRKFIKLEVEKTIAQLSLLPLSEVENKNLITRKEAEELCEKHLGPNNSEQNSTQNEKKKRRKFYNAR